MGIPKWVRAEVREHPEWLPLLPLHGWKSSPHDGDHVHCRSCCRTIYLGDAVVGTYLKNVSIVFCPQCVAENPDVFSRWLSHGPGH
ncbi:MAG: hypothetical protein K8U57_40270 [Planctomycetes bacterium]|nr:hypothetical protein [Planctomycetota bacterium]